MKNRIKLAGLLLLALLIGFLVWLLFVPVSCGTV